MTMPAIRRVAGIRVVKDRIVNGSTPMATPAILISFFGLFVFGGGIIDYSDSDSDADTSTLAFVIAAGTCGLGLLVGGIGVLLLKELALVFAPFVTLLFTALFACHVVVTGAVLPAGLMVILGLVALVLFHRRLRSKETL
jgi:uncharacterized membrane protein (UPF0136 family)